MEIGAPAVQFAVWVYHHTGFRPHDPDQRPFGIYTPAADAGSLGHMLFCTLFTFSHLPRAYFGLFY